MPKPCLCPSPVPSQGPGVHWKSILHCKTSVLGSAGFGLETNVRAFVLWAGGGFSAAMGSSVMAHPAGWNRLGLCPSTDPGEFMGHSDLLCPPCFDKMPLKRDVAVKLILSRGSLSRSCSCEQQLWVG